MKIIIRELNKIKHTKKYGWKAKNHFRDNDGSTQIVTH